MKINRIGGILSLGYILLMCLVSLLAYELAPDASPSANQMHLSIHSKPPGFKTKMLLIPLETDPSESSFFWGTPSQYDEIPIQAWRFQDTTLEIQLHGAAEGFLSQLT